MKLSIIIPVYNVENYILDCLNSVYDGNLKEFEVLCIDDRGQDKSISIIQQYVKDNKIDNLKILVHDENKGLSEARNTGIRQAKGKYICFLDSDDMIKANGLKKLVEQAQRCDLDAIEGKIEEIFETNLSINTGNGKRTRKTTEILTGDEYFSLCCKNDEYVPMAWCRIFKAEYLKEKYFFKPGLKFEDEEFSPRVIIKATRIQYYNESFYIYRRRDNSITTNMVKNNKWVDSYLEIIKYLSEFSNEIVNKKSYEYLKDRIANLVISLYKNPIAYGATEENFQKIVEIVKKEKLYEIPLNRKKFIIKAQGYLMKYPKMFTRLYNYKGKGRYYVTPVN